MPKLFLIVLCTLGLLTNYHRRQGSYHMMSLSSNIFSSVQALFWSYVNFAEFHSVLDLSTSRVMSVFRNHSFKQWNLTRKANNFNKSQSLKYWNISFWASSPLFRTLVSHFSIQCQILMKLSSHNLFFVMHGYSSTLYTKNQYKGVELFSNFFRSWSKICFRFHSTTVLRLN